MLTDGAVTHERVTENRHLALIDMVVHFLGPLGKFDLELLEVHFLANDLRDAVPNDLLVVATAANLIIRVDGDKNSLLFLHIF